MCEKGTQNQFSEACSAALCQTFSKYHSTFFKMKKSEIEAEILTAVAVVPAMLDVTSKTWWKTIPSEHLVDVHYPYERHGLSGKASNNAKLDAKKDFLKFVDDNSQENGRRFDSKNPTHYFLPKFTTITIPKTTDPKYQEKLRTSLTGEFNQVQTELGKETISDFSAGSWLKIERPKHAIYPHKVDYCDTCASFKIQIQSKQQVINQLIANRGRK